MWWALFIWMENSHACYCKVACAELYMHARKQVNELYRLVSCSLPPRHWPFVKILNSKVCVQSIYGRFMCFKQAIWTPCIKSASSSRHAFPWVFISSRTHLCENPLDHRSEVTWHFVLARRHKICPKSAFCILKTHVCLCTQHMPFGNYWFLAHPVRRTRWAYAMVWRPASFRPSVCPQFSKCFFFVISQPILILIFS